MDPQKVLGLAAMMLLIHYREQMHLRDQQQSHLLTLQHIHTQRLAVCMSTALRFREAQLAAWVQVLQVLPLSLQMLGMPPERPRGPRLPLVYRYRLWCAKLAHSWAGELRCLTHPAEFASLNAY